MNHRRPRTQVSGGFHPIAALLLAIPLLLLQSGCEPGSNQSILLYRLPYADGTQTYVSRDHITHTPPDRLDMVGVNGQAPYPVVAAQTGIIRFIVDHHTEVCCGGSCANNYVWIEHLFGEWTKYSHLATGSVTDIAGLSVGDVVLAGEFLGFESNVGRACGVHLHFEVGVPNDPLNPLTASNGGFINGANRVPRFCGVPGQIATAESTYTAGPCSALLQCVRSSESPTTAGNCASGLSGNVCVQQLHPAALGSTYTRGIDFDSPMVKLDLDWCPTADCDPSVNTGRAIHVIFILDDPANPNADPLQFTANCQNRKLVVTVNHVAEIIIQEAPNLSSENVVCQGNEAPNAYAMWEICEVNPFFDQ